MKKQTRNYLVGVGAIAAGIGAYYWYTSKTETQDYRPLPSVVPEYPDRPGTPDLSEVELISNGNGTATGAGGANDPRDDMMSSCEAQYGPLWVPGLTLPLIAAVIGSPPGFMVNPNWSAACRQLVPGLRDLT